MGAAVRVVSAIISPVGEMLSAICSQAFIEGFKKGYSTHKKENNR